MRIIEYPPAEPELQVRCPHCKALLGYTASECFWESTGLSDHKYTRCLYCKKKIILESIPIPIPIGEKFFEFSDNSWAESIKQ